MIQRNQSTSKVISLTSFQIMSDHSVVDVCGPPARPAAAGAHMRRGCLAVAPPPPLPLPPCVRVRVHVARLCLFALMKCRRNPPGFQLDNATVRCRRGCHVFPSTHLCPGALRVRLCVSVCALVRVCLCLFFFFLFFFPPRSVKCQACAGVFVC